MQRTMTFLFVFLSVLCSLTLALAANPLESIMSPDQFNTMRQKSGYAVGTIVKAQGRPELYMMVPVGRAALIPTMTIINCLGIQDRRPVEISPRELKEMAKSPLLLKSPGGTIYRISGDRKRPIANPAVFQRLGYDPASVLPMTDAQLNCIKDGDPIQ